MKHIALGLLLGIFLFGCTTFSNNVLRTEMTATALVYGGYQGYTQALASGVLHIDPTNQAAIKKARLEFAASVGTVEAFRLAYETNSALQPNVQAALDAMMMDSSNVVYLIHLFSN